jgi:hypothetical protein
MPTANKVLNKTIFTRITLDKASLQAVFKVQNKIPNYDVNDAVKFILGLGMGQLDNILAFQPDFSFSEIEKKDINSAISRVKDGKVISFQNEEEMKKYFKEI